MSDNGHTRTALDFFAGSGLVSEGLSPFFATIWANDICEKKAAVFCANHSWKAFTLGAIEGIKGERLPEAELSWASFPCQDLSLAGNMRGISAERSGLVWHWLRIMDEMGERRPPVLAAENVAGLVSAEGGAHYRLLHNALVERGYKVGALLLDAVNWVPQSRKRVFVVAVRRDVYTRCMETAGPTWCHPGPVQNAAKGLKDWVWWRLPSPPRRKTSLEDVIDFEAPMDEEDKSGRVLALVPEAHRKKIEREKRLSVFPGYKRVRNGRQVLELRFDGVAGCLRTPEGGSSRQFLVIRRNGALGTRLLTVREAAALMGVREGYKIPGTYNDGYRAMGDAVVVPVVRYLSQHLLAPLADITGRNECECESGQEAGGIRGKGRNEGERAAVCGSCGHPARAGHGIAPGA